MSERGADFFVFLAKKESGEEEKEKQAFLIIINNVRPHTYRKPTITPYRKTRPNGVWGGFAAIGIAQRLATKKTRSGVPWIQNKIKKKGEEESIQVIASQPTKTRIVPHHEFNSQRRRIVRPPAIIQT